MITVFFAALVWGVIFAAGFAVHKAWGPDLRNLFSDDPAVDNDPPRLVLEGREYAARRTVERIEAVLINGHKRPADFETDHDYVDYLIKDYNSTLTATGG